MGPPPSTQALPAAPGTPQPTQASPSGPVLTRAAQNQFQNSIWSFKTAVNWPRGASRKRRVVKTAREFMMPFDNRCVQNVLFGKTARSLTSFFASRKIENRFKPLLVQWERLLRFPKFLLLYQGGNLALFRAFLRPRPRASHLCLHGKSPSLPTCSQLLFNKILQK